MAAFARGECRAFLGQEAFGLGAIHEHNISVARPEVNRNVVLLF
jgi:hypothetical protein